MKKSSELFTVHASADPSLARRAECLTIVPDGFSWGAFFWGPLWLAAHRAWGAAAVQAVFLVGIETAVLLGALHPAAAWAGALAAAAFVGFEGQEWRRAAAARRGLVLSDIRVAGAAAEAEAGALREMSGSRGPWETFA